MYWSDAYLGRIETARIDGTGRMLLLADITFPNYFSFLLRGGNIYITDWEYTYVYLFLPR